MNIGVYVIIFVSLSYSNDDIINIPLDPISHNNFYLNSIYPKYQSDFFDEGYTIESNIGSPFSVYAIQDLYIDLSDSVRTHSSLLYNQGDVGYRRIAIDIKTRIGDSGILKLLGNGTYYPGKSAQYLSTMGNVLQNYLMQFSKKYNTSDISFYTGYHIENRDLHITCSGDFIERPGVSGNITAPPAVLL